jgi:hypothetical protein
MVSDLYLSGWKAQSKNPVLAFSNPDAKPSL